MMLWAFSPNSQILSSYSILPSSCWPLEPTCLYLLSPLSHRPEIPQPTDTYHPAHPPQGHQWPPCQKANEHVHSLPYLHEHGPPSWNNFFHRFPWHHILLVVSPSFLAKLCQPFLWFPVVLLISQTSVPDRSLTCVTHKRAWWWPP